MHPPWATISRHGAKKLWIGNCASSEKQLCHSGIICNNSSFQCCPVIKFVFGAYINIETSVQIGTRLLYVPLSDNFVEGSDLLPDVSVFEGRSLEHIHQTSYTIARRRPLYRMGRCRGRRHFREDSSRSTLRSYV